MLHLAKTLEFLLRKSRQHWEGDVMYCVAMSKRLNCKLNIYDYVDHSFQHNDNVRCNDWYRKTLKLLKINFKNCKPLTNSFAEASDATSGIVTAPAIFAPGYAATCFRRQFQLLDVQPSSWVSQNQILKSMCKKDMNLDWQRKYRSRPH